MYLEAFPDVEWLERAETHEWGYQELRYIPPIPLSSPERNALKAEILALELELELSRLPADRESSTDLIQRKRACLAPVRRLQPELLSEIFLCLAEVERESFAFPEALFYPPPIQRVCKSWRDTALSTTSLFTRIKIGRSWALEERTVAERYISHFRLIEEMKNWLLNSHSAPLVLFYFGSSYGGNLDASSIELAWAALSKHISRCIKLTIYIDPTIHSMIWSEAQFVAERLEELSIHGTSVFAQSVANRSSPYMAIESDRPLFPRLRTLSIATSNLNLLAWLFVNAPVLDHLLLDLARGTLRTKMIELINQTYPTILKVTLIDITPPPIDAHRQGTVDFRKPQFHLDHLTHGHIKHRTLQKTTVLSLFEPCVNLTTLTMDGLMRTTRHLAILKQVTSLHLLLDKDQPREKGIHQPWEKDIHHCFLSFPSVLNLRLFLRKKGEHRFGAPERRHITGVERFLYILSFPICCPRLTMLAIENGVFSSGELLNLASSYSEAVRPTGELLISLKNCFGWPDVDLLNESRLRSVWSTVKDKDHENSMYEN